MKDRYMTAIIIDVVNGERKGRKYHNVKNTQEGKQRFEKFAKKTFPHCTGIYYYGEITRNLLYCDHFLPLRSQR